jgi:hypothetical protein
MTLFGRLAAHFSWILYYFVMDQLLKNQYRMSREARLPDPFGTDFYGGQGAKRLCPPQSRNADAEADAF